MTLRITQEQTIAAATLYAQQQDKVMAAYLFFAADERMSDDRALTMAARCVMTDMLTMIAGIPPTERVPLMKNRTWIALIDSTLDLYLQAAANDPSITHMGTLHD